FGGSRPEVAGQVGPGVLIAAGLVVKAHGLVNAAFGSQLDAIGAFAARVNPRLRLLQADRQQLEQLVVELVGHGQRARLDDQAHALPALPLVEEVNKLLVEQGGRTATEDDGVIFGQVFGRGGQGDLLLGGVLAPPLGFDDDVGFLGVVAAAQAVV